MPAWACAGHALLLTGEHATEILTGSESTLRLPSRRRACTPFSAADLTSRQLFHLKPNVLQLYHFVVVNQPAPHNLRSWTEMLPPSAAGEDRCTGATDACAPLFRAPMCYPHGALAAQASGFLMDVTEANSIETLVTKIEDELGG